MSSNPRVTSLNLQAMSTISQVTSSNRPIEMKWHGNSLTNYLGSELISLVYLRFSEETCKEWVEAVSFSKIIFKLASYSNPQKLVLFHGYAKRRIECLCFSEYYIHWNTKILFFMRKNNW